MVLIEKCLNHTVWILNALKEHNRIARQEMKAKMTDKRFILNADFQKYFYSFTLYLKLIQNVDKGYQLMAAKQKINRHNLMTIRNTYLIRGAVYFREAGSYLKKARQQLSVSPSAFSLLYGEMKQIAGLLQSLESDLNYLIGNLY